MNTLQFVTESNRIEGILRPPTKEELAEHNRFMSASLMTIEQLVQFVSVYQPDATLRDREGLNVRVGDHFPEKGGPHILTKLQAILVDANSCRCAFRVHLAYENLHPFTDGNGRSGRALWAWQMRYDSAYHPHLLFLHAWYYQTLSSESAKVAIPANPVALSVTEAFHDSGEAPSVGRDNENQGADQVSENPSAVQGQWTIEEVPGGHYLCYGGRRILHTIHDNSLSEFREIERLANASLKDDL